MSMFLNVELTDFYFSGGRAELLPVEMGEWVDTCVNELPNSASWSFSCNPPAVVPYLGMYLTDLAFVKKEHQTLLRKASSISPR